MNPFEWKREHQIALVAATLLGFAIGMAFGYARGDSLHFSDWLYYAFNPHYGNFGEFGWGIFGAIIGAAVIYLAQLMRR
jgi:hypothetical protein